MVFKLPNRPRRGRVRSLADQSRIRQMGDLSDGARCPVCRGVLRGRMVAGRPTWACDCPPPADRAGVPL